jgi:hypothetical protein
MEPTPGRLIAEIERETNAPVAASPMASYRVPLAVIHGLWAQQQYEQARLYVEQVALQPKYDEDGRLEKFLVRPGAWHAIPLIAEAVLIEIEAGHLRQGEMLLRELRGKALELGDYETLGRLGRLFKDSGDRRWAESQASFDRFRNAPGWQLYKEAKKVYEEAFLATDDYYTGINAATLALLTHDPTTAELHAQRVSELCSSAQDIPIDDRPWLFATEGEAAVILNNPQAVTFYTQALNELIPGDGGKANSMYKQLCRLWKALGERVVPVLELFETSEFAAMLSNGYLGRIPVTTNLGRQSTEAKN